MCFDKSPSLATSSYPIKTWMLYKDIWLTVSCSVQIYWTWLHDVLLNNFTCLLCSIILKLKGSSYGKMYPVWTSSRFYRYRTVIRKLSNIYGDFGELALNLMIYWLREKTFCHLNRSSLFYNTSARHERHECYTSETRTTRMWHEWKLHTPVFAIWQMKHYKESNNFITRTNFCKCLLPMPKCVWKVHHKNWTLQW